MTMAGLRRAGTLAAALLLLGGATDEAPQPVAPLEGAGWELAWSDEFDGDSLDRTKWAPEVSCWGGGNAERQCYTDRPENIAVEGGMLLLKARKERFTGPARPPEIAEKRNPDILQFYTSGKVRTRGLHAWRYGRIEIRAKVPPGQGAWPAVWMMPAHDIYGPWPLSGEIDILEAVNIGAKCKVCEGGKGENRTISALHFGDLAPKNRFVDHRNALPDLALPSDDFHVYAVEWGEGLIRSWNEGWIDAPQRVGAMIAPLIGADTDEVISADSTSVNLYKLIVAALRLDPSRKVVVSEAGNFPTDLQIAEGAVQAVAGAELRVVERGALAEAMGDDTWEQLLRWQMTVNAAFAGGSVTAALINLGALIAVSMARSALSQLALARSPAGYHG